MLKLKCFFLGVKENKTTTVLNFSVKNEEIDVLDLEVVKKEFGYLYFNPNEAKKEVEAIMKKRNFGISFHGKSPSSRLRGVLFQEWTETGEDISFENYYTQKINAIIKNIYENLPK